MEKHKSEDTDANYDYMTKRSNVVPLSQAELAAFGYAIELELTARLDGYDYFIAVITKLIAIYDLVYVREIIKNINFDSRGCENVLDKVFTEHANSDFINLFDINEKYLTACVWRICSHLTLSSTLYCDALRKLLQMGASKEKSVEFFSALCRCHNMDYVKIFVEEGVPIYGSATHVPLIYLACEYNFKKCFDFVVQYQSEYLTSGFGARNESLMHVAHHGMVTHLLSCGADIDALVSMSFTPLHRAISESNINKITVLLKNGASTTKKTHFLANPLHWACRTSGTALLHILPYYNGDINELSTAGTPLDILWDVGCGNTTYAEKIKEMGGILTIKPTTSQSVYVMDTHKEKCIKMNKSVDPDVIDQMFKLLKIDLLK